jgi:hypothetical protein
LAATGGIGLEILRAQLSAAAGWAEVAVSISFSLGPFNLLATFVRW